MMAIWVEVSPGHALASARDMDFLQFHLQMCSFSDQSYFWKLGWQGHGGLEQNSCFVGRQIQASQTNPTFQEEQEIHTRMCNLPFKILVINSKSLARLINTLQLTPPACLLLTVNLHTSAFPAFDKHLSRTCRMPADL